MTYKTYKRCFISFNPCLREFSEKTKREVLGLYIDCSMTTITKANILRP